MIELVEVHENSWRNGKLISFEDLHNIEIDLSLPSDISIQNNTLNINDELLRTYTD